MNIHVVLNLLFQIFVSISLVSSESQSSWTILVSENGTVNVVDLETTPEDSKHTLQELREDVIFYLFTASNPEDGQQIYLGKDDILEASYFNVSNPTRIVIHGWQSSVSGAISTLIRDAYLSVGDYNVIVVDWSSYASRDYITARSKIVTVGEYVGLLIDYLETNGVILNDLIIVGHSLGAHVSGIAGRSAVNDVGVIIALDPAGPLFYFIDLYAKLRSTDAIFVQVIHTSAGFLGHKDNLGDVDIWVNGGSLQAGCGLDLFRTCSHQRAYRIFAESVQDYEKPFSAKICDNESDFNRGKCDSNNSTHLGGIKVDTQARGVHHVKTNPESSYAI